MSIGRRSRDWYLAAHHQITDQLLNVYFYEGLLHMDRSMVDAASGGALVDKTPAVARDLISNMAANAQQFGTRSNSVYHVQSISPSRPPSAPSPSPYVDQQILTNKLDELTSLVRQLAVTQTANVAAASSQSKHCGICSDPSHSTDACPTMQEEGYHQDPTVAAAGVFPGRPQHNPYFNTYNPGWKEHPNLR